MFPNVHVEYSGKFHGKDVPESDRNRISPNKQESRFVRCKWCNFPVDKFRRPKGDGWGGNISYEAISGTNLKNPVVTGAGCVFCGSSEYE